MICDGNFRLEEEFKRKTFHVFKVTCKAKKLRLRHCAPCRLATLSPVALLWPPGWGRYACVGKRCAGQTSAVSMPIDARCG